MKRFVRKTLVFCSILAGAVLLTLILSTKAVSAYFPFRLSDTTRIVILGDSHPQCGIDDALLPGSINLAAGSDTYFYSYIKLKRLVAENPQIETVILGYSYHNIEIGQDRWLTDQATNAHKLPLYFFMFDSEDTRTFLRLNRFQLVANTPLIIKKNGRHLQRIAQETAVSGFDIGGHKRIRREISKKERDSALGYKDRSPIEAATVDIGYLNKIVYFCRQKQIKLILIGLPVLHNMKKNPHFARQYRKYAKDNLAGVTILDFVETEFPSDCFADGGHLNQNGAARFTGLLAKTLERH